MENQRNAEGSGGGGGGEYGTFQLQHTVKTKTHPDCSPEGTLYLTSFFSLSTSFMQITTRSPSSAA